MRKFFIGCAILCSLTSAAAATVRGEKSGSAYIIYVTNSSERPIQCSGTIYADYDDFGTRKSTSSPFNGTVPARTDNYRMVVWQTTWPGSTLVFRHDAQCS